MIPVNIKPNWSTSRRLASETAFPGQEQITNQYPKSEQGGFRSRVWSYYAPTQQLSETQMKVKISAVLVIATTLLLGFLPLLVILAIEGMRSLIHCDDPTKPKDAQNGTAPTRAHTQDGLDGYVQDIYHPQNGTARTRVHTQDGKTYSYPQYHQDIQPIHRKNVDHVQVAKSEIGREDIPVALQTKFGLDIETDYFLDEFINQQIKKGTTYERFVDKLWRLVSGIAQKHQKSLKELESTPEYLFNFDWSHFRLLLDSTKKKALRNQARALFEGLVTDEDADFQKKQERLGLVGNRFALFLSNLQKSQNNCLLSIFHEIKQSIIARVYRNYETMDDYLPSSFRYDIKPQLTGEEEILHGTLEKLRRDVSFVRDQKNKELDEQLENLHDTLFKGSHKSISQDYDHSPIVEQYPIARRASSENINIPVKNFVSTSAGAIHVRLDRRTSLDASTPFNAPSYSASETDYPANINPFSSDTPSQDEKALESTKTAYPTDINPFSSDTPSQDEKTVESTKIAYPADINPFSSGTPSQDEKTVESTKTDYPSNINPFSSDTPSQDEKKVIVKRENYRDTKPLSTDTLPVFASSNKQIGNLEENHDDLRIRKQLEAFVSKFKNDGGTPSNLFQSIFKMILSIGKKGEDIPETIQKKMSKEQQRIIGCVEAIFPKVDQNKKHVAHGNSGPLRKFLYGYNPDNRSREITGVVANLLLDNMAEKLADLLSLANKKECKETWLHRLGLKIESKLMDQVPRESLDKWYKKDLEKRANNRFPIPAGSKKTKELKAQHAQVKAQRERYVDNEKAIQRAKQTIERYSGQGMKVGGSKPSRKTKKS